jgi:hypothetical protein
MKKYLLLIIFYTAGNFIMASPKSNIFTKTTASDPVKKIVKAIAKSNVYDLSATNNIAPPNSPQNLRYEKLLNIASVEKLTELATKNKNAVVRLYAYKALINKIKDIPKGMVDQFNNDTTIINTINGNTAGQVPLNSIAKGFLY